MTFIWNVPDSLGVGIADLRHSRQSYGYRHSLAVERAVRQSGIDAGHGVVLGQVDAAGQLLQGKRYS